MISTAEKDCVFLLLENSVHVPRLVNTFDRYGVLDSAHFDIFTSSTVTSIIEGVHAIWKREVCVFNDDEIANCYLNGRWCFAVNRRRVLMLMCRHSLVIQYTWVQT